MIGSPMGHLSDAILLELLAGRLDESGLRSVDEHLDSCAECLALTGALVGPAVGMQGGERREPGRVGRYEVARELGRGAMGVVLEARDPELDRAVALKLLHVTGATMRERLVREGKALAKLSHPNVVAVFEVGEHDGEVFLAMELVRGATLREWLRTARAPDEVLRVFHEAAVGLAAAHRSGLVHRDFKPDNVLVGDDGRARIGDFGLARGSEERLDAASREATAEPDLTASGVLVGTPAYMAPELLGGGEATAASDQFALAVSLFEALEGTRPWAGRTPKELERAMLRAPAEPARRAPRRVARALARALSRVPGARFPSIEALDDALAPPRPRRVAPLVGLGLVAVALGGLALSRGRAPAPPARCELAGLAAQTELSSERLEALAGPLGPGRAALARRVVTRVQAFRERWASESELACRETHVVGARSADLLDRETACLSRRLGEVVALVATVEAGPPERGGAAAEALLVLDPLDACTTPSALVGAEPRPREPARAAELAALEAKLSSASAALRAGQAAEAEAAARELLGPAERVGHQPFLADVELLLAASHRALGALDLAEHHASRAILAAERGRADPTLARAWLERAADFGERREARRALEHVDHADAVLARLGRPALLDATSLHLRGAALGELGELEQAEGALRGALARRERALGPESRDVAKTLTALGNVLRARALAATPPASLAEARRTFERARAIDEAELGPGHAALARHDHNLAGLDRVEGKLDAALARYEAALAAERRSLGARSLAVARTLNSLGLVALARGDAQKALALFDDSAAIFRERAHPDLASALHDAALALVALGRTADALARWDEALALPAPGGTSRETLLAARGEVAAKPAASREAPRAPGPPAVSPRFAPGARPAPSASARPAPTSYLPAPGWEH